ncbi:MAG: hypothetical protein HYV04_03100 [Deltaproteobacteria bacterium]|nr:hypothetical protein [Deltaproteobacteria bacterium]
MKLSVKSLTIAAALFWAGTVFFVAFLNFLSPSYGKAFLDIVSSVYPGYKVVGTFGSVIVATLYALVDGAIGGLVFGWLYNCFAK